MKQIVFATNNEYKLEEVRIVLSGLYKIMSLKDIGCVEDLPENQDTLEGNAIEKAKFVADKYKIDCFADDTGLEIRVLGNAPGVFSARYAGPGRESEANMERVLTEMKGSKDRTAKFRTVVALIENNKVHIFEGEVTGKILEERKGKGGFGYDPIFLPDGFDRTFAQLTTKEKNEISHRGRAVRKLIEYLSGELS